MTKKVPPGGQKMNFGKNQLHEVDQRAMPIGKMVLLLILPFGNPKSANGRHPYLRKLFPFVLLRQLITPVETSISKITVMKGALSRTQRRLVGFFTPIFWNNHTPVIIEYVAFLRGCNSFKKSVIVRSRYEFHCSIFLVGLFIFL